MISYDVHFGGNFPGELHKACSAAEKILAVQVMKDTAPFVPASPARSMAIRTHIVGKSIVYPGPYARYQFMGKAMVDSVTGRGPFFIPGVGYRFRKGAKLRPTNRSLKYNRSVHANATDHWTDASWDKNHNKWAEVARKAVAKYGR